MNEQNYRAIPLDVLAPFKHHPFKLYEGKRKDEMVESVKANGILTPIIVRPTSEDGKFEILSGHNRVAAAKEAGLENVPAVVREDLKGKDEATLLVVTLTNLQQRGFSELSHSERAKVIKLTYNSLKRQGQRNDLLDEVDVLVGGKELLSANLKKLTPKEAIAEQFSMTPNNIAYYIRLDKLIPQLLERLDNGDFELTVAEKLTYLSKDEQKTVNSVSKNVGVRLTIGKAKALVNAAKKETLTEEAVREILTFRQTRKSSYRLNVEVFEQYFADIDEEENIDDIIAEALALWKQSRE